MLRVRETMPRGTVSDYDFIHWIKWWWDASRDPFPWSCLSEEDSLCQNVAGDIYDGIMKTNCNELVDANAGECGYTLVLVEPTHKSKRALLISLIAMMLLNSIPLPHLSRQCEKLSCLTAVHIGAMVKTLGNPQFVRGIWPSICAVSYMVRKT